MAIIAVTIVSRIFRLATALSLALSQRISLRRQELTLDSGPDCRVMPHGLHLGYLTRLRRLTLLKQVVYGLQVK